MKDKEGWTPLHFAASNGQVRMVEWLVRERKAEVEVQANDGRTPLHFAASNGQVGVVEWLVREGKAKVGVKDKSGDTPLQDAINQKHLAVQYWFRSHALFTQPANVAKQSAASASHLKDLRQLLSEVDQYTGKDKSALVASLMRLYLEALATNRELQSNFLDASVLKYQTRWFSVLDQPEQQKCLQSFIQLGLIELIKALGRQQLTSLTLQHIEFFAPQAKALTTLLQFNPTLTSLNLQHITFSNLNLHDLLTILTACQPRLQTFILTNSQLTDHKLLCLLPALLNCTKLQRMDLSGNLLSLTSLEKLVDALKKQPHPALTELSLAHNHIEIVDVRLFDELSSSLRGHSFLKSIELAGNAVWSEKHNKEFKALWWMLLRQSQLSVQELVNAEFIKLDSSPEQPEKCLLQLKLNDQEIKNIQLTNRDIEVFYAFRACLNPQIDAQVFKHLQAIQKLLMPLVLRQQTLENHLIDETAQNSVCKQILDYYSDSPLKSRLRTHPIFKSTPCAAIKSLIMPELEITPNDWYVYLISTSNNPLNDHAMIAYEGLTQYGQRFLKVAHLVYNNTDSKMKVEYYARPPEQGKKGIASTVHYLTTRCTLAVLPATRKQVSNLDKAVRDDTRRNIEDSFQWYIIRSLQTNAFKQKEVQNCLKWALGKINDHLFNDEKAKIDPSVYVPLLVVKSLNTQRPLPASAANPSPKVAPLDYAQGEGVKEGKQENNNSYYSTRCLVM